MLDSIASYLAITKDEQAAIATYVKSDPATRQAAAQLTAKAASISSPAALLADRSSLGVILQAFGLSSSIGQPAVLRALMTEDPTASTSLAVRSASSSYQAFAGFMANVQSVQIQLGPPSATRLPVSNASASTITLQNTAATTPSTATTAAPGQRWSFVLNDGSAAASVANALAAAAGGNAHYIINANGSVTGSFGAPVVTAHPPAAPAAGAPAGATTYTFALAADASGVITQQASVVSVPVEAGSTPAATSAQTAALQSAMQQVGFTTTLSETGMLTIAGNLIDASSHPGVGGTSTIPGASGFATASAAAGTTVVPFGAAGAQLQPGQIVRNGTAVLGTVASVDAQGQVTLSSPHATTIGAGDYLTADPLVQSYVPGAASAATARNIGQRATLAASVAMGATALQLNVPGLQPGQTLGALQADGSVTPIGTIQSAAADGTVTLIGPANAAASAATPIVISAAVTGHTGPALQDPGHVTTAITAYQQSRFEHAQDSNNPGMGNALAFTRQIGGITTINGLMANAGLLAVVTTALGLPAAFGGLSFEQQSRIITAAVKPAMFQDPQWVKNTAERYLVSVAASQPTPAPTGMLALFNSGNNAGQSILAALTGQVLTGAASPNPTLGLFA